MRSRKSAQAAAADPAADTASLPFQVGDLVLCRYSNYPYWPATIDPSHQKNQKGRYVRWSDTEPKKLLFWCTFSNEDTGGWVRSDRMALFHPDLAKRITVPDDRDEHKSQMSAIRAADDAFNQLNKDKPNVPIPPAPTDVLNGKTSYSDDEQEEEDADDGNTHEDPDLDEKSDQEAPAPPPPPAKSRKSFSSAKRRKSAPAAPPSAPAKAKASQPSPTTRPRAKKEPRKTTKRKSAPAPATSPRAAKKPKTVTKPPERRRSLAKKEPAVLPPRQQIAPEQSDTPPSARTRRPSRQQTKVDEPRSHAAARISELQRSLEAANSTISKLKRSLRKKENQIAELTNGASPVHVKHPPQPEVTEMPLPPKSEYRSNSMNGKDFTVVIAELRSQYDVFTENVRKASGLRVQLEEESKSIEEKISKLITSVVESERIAAQSETELAKMLRNILLADVQVADLRAHKAGTLLKAMTKKCKDMQLIFDYSSAIYETWMSQVMKHMHPGDKKEAKGDAAARKIAAEAMDVENGNGPDSDKGKTDDDNEKENEKEGKSTGDDMEMKDVEGDEKAKGGDHKEIKDDTAAEGDTKKADAAKKDDDTDKMEDEKDSDANDSEAEVPASSKAGKKPVSAPKHAAGKDSDGKKAEGSSSATKSDRGIRETKSSSTDTPRSVTVPAETPAEGKKSKEESESSKVSDGKGSASNVQTDAKDAPQQKLPPSAKEEKA